jgi:hypothetical protein
MRAALGPLGLIAFASVAGLACSELLFRSTEFRNAAGRLAGRGHLVAVAGGVGIYEGDLEGGDEAALADLIATANLRRAAAREPADPARIEHGLALFKAQFVSEDAFREALSRSHLSVSWLRQEIAQQICGLQWLEKQAEPPAQISEQEVRQFYEAHRDFFLEPARFRASHLFLAAHARTPPEVIAEKKLAIADLSARLARGESFSQLAAEASEDEATKSRGGDLGFFSRARVAPEFFAEIEKLGAGQTSRPFRSHLGFHIAQVQETRVAARLTFEQARAEISGAMAKERRLLSVARLRETLARQNNF